MKEQKYSYSQTLKQAHNVANAIHRYITAQYNATTALQRSATVKEKHQ